MRYLNKIVFINSAGKSIPYAEINLDGNVHFIGTQGVGKSTLLRAILFFYNADTRKLGIREGQKSYTEFYYPFLNSYIVYEVKTDNGAFTVFSFKHQNQVAFRFIGSEYRKENYITDNKAFDSWEQIRDSFDKNVAISSLVSKYSDYRDIIYGNNKELDRKFRNYYLLESKQYQKVPLTISNVFLNTKLDASVIKQTIISSLAEDSEPIELARYSNHLKDFDKHLGDIKRWTEKDSRGNSVVEKLAEKISGSYTKLILIEKEKQENASQLGFAVERTQNAQPKIEQKLAAQKTQKTKLENDLNIQIQNFENIKSQLNQEIGKISGEIEKAENRQQFYQKKDIQTVISRVENENIVISQKESLEKQKNILTDKFKDVESRFKAIKKQFEDDFKQLKTNKEAEKISAKELYLSDCETIRKNNAQVVEQIRTQSKEQLSYYDNLMSDKTNEITKQTIELELFKKEILYKTEIDSKQSEISDLQRKITENESLKNTLKEKKDSLLKNFEKEKGLISDRCDIQSDKLKNEKELLKSQSDEIKAKLENFKGSFYEWLNTEYPEWENNIGQVVSEDILFNKNLNPQMLSSEEQTLYGVKIDLDETAKQIQTIDDYNAENKDIENHILTLTKQIQDCQTNKNNEIDKLQKNCNNEVKKLNDSIKQCDYIITQSTPKIEIMQIELDKLHQKSVDDKAAKLAVLTQQLSKAISEKNDIESQKKNYVKETEAKISVQNDVCDKQLQERNNTCNNTVQKVDAEIVAANNEMRNNILLAQTDRDNELKNKGADTNKINALEKQIYAAENELKYIKDNRKLVSDYQKDKEELFDRMEEFMATRNKFEADLKFESQKFHDQKTKIETALKTVNQSISDLQIKLNGIKYELDKFEEYTQTEDYQSLKPYIENYSFVNQNDLTISTLIAEITSKNQSYAKEFDTISENVNKFTGYFDENNIFSFQTKCGTKQEYFKFAENLDEFIRENKFAEFKKRFEDRFANIVSVIGSEIQKLIDKAGEIQGIITEINKGFSTRNFVGAINSLELRTTESENKIYRALVDIKKFNTENFSSFGFESNLFNVNNDLDKKNSEAVDLLVYLSKEIADTKENYITLSDSFELEFRIVENNQDSGWVQKLSNVGSEGTDILIKAMINIMLLNVFKERAIRKSKSEFRLHCMMDEIGKLHSSNVKGILNFASEMNIYLINSSPNPTNPLDYQYTYILRRDDTNKTSVTRLISK